MNDAPIFLRPIFKEAIWGGSNLNKVFKYNIPSDSTSECWGIAAHKNGDCIIENGEYEGRTLSDLWKNNRELFNNSTADRFPYLIKILDANKNLSVQVHPDSDYAKINENGEYGKYECWYILDCEPNTKLILGHKCNSKEDLIKSIEDNLWDDILREVDIKAGDFILIPPGTIHALKGGTLALEIQQNSDLTYRLFDYNRKDKSGNLRELHLKKALDVIRVPFEPSYIDERDILKKNISIAQYVNSDIFKIEKWSLKGQSDFENKSYILIAVIDGQGQIIYGNNMVNFSKGQYFIIPSGLKNFSLNGESELMVCIP